MFVGRPRGSFTVPRPSLAITPTGASEALFARGPRGPDRADAPGSPPTRGEPADNGDEPRHGGVEEHPNEGLRIAVRIRRRPKRHARDPDARSGEQRQDDAGAKAAREEDPEEPGNGKRRSYQEQRTVHREVR